MVINFWELTKAILSDAVIAILHTNPKYITSKYIALQLIGFTSKEWPESKEVICTWRKDNSTQNESCTFLLFLLQQLSLPERKAMCFFSLFSNGNCLSQKQRACAVFSPVHIAPSYHSHSIVNQGARLPCPNHLYVEVILVDVRFAFIFGLHPLFS